MFTHHHRTFCYAIYVAYTMCRFLYFDRSGAFASPPFDWTVTASPIHTLLWKFAHMQDHQWGYDPTATLESGYAARRFRDMGTGPSARPEVQQYLLCDIKYVSHLQVARNSGFDDIGRRIALAR
ncbi:hypothetical protein C8Q76DRAFT_329124 [Earliella scabrosa]|nr:hypothetical protein C8Q76DRAFT_329124 [Earliella scabrosa]